MQYPLTKQVAGPHYWISLHSVASEYPKEGTAKDTEEFKRFVHYFIEHFPCRECKEHGLYYFHNKPPTGTTRKEIFDWACRFHNYVNKKTDKQEVDCNSLLVEGDSCKTCTIKQEKKVMGESIPVRLADMKASSIRLFEQLCHEEGLPVPRIIFRECPPLPWTSCVKISDDNSTATVYLNPSQYGVKTVVHEFVHYREKMRGNDKLAADEYEVDRMALAIIKKHFPQETEVVSGNAKLVLAEGDASIVNKRMSSIKKRFPHYGSYLDEDRLSRLESEVEHEKKEKNDGGFVSMFDDVYAPLGQLLGVDKRDLSSVQVSQIVGSIAGALMDANLSPLGSVIASTISSVALFGTGVFARDSMSRGDRRFLANLSSNLFYENIRVLANPRELPTVLENAKVVGYHLGRLDFANLVQNLTASYYLRAYPATPDKLAPPSTPTAAPQVVSPPLSQDLGTRFSPGEISRAQERAFQEASGPTRRYTVGPGVAVPPGDTDLGTYGPISAGPIPFPEVTPAIPVDDYFDPGNPNISNPGNEALSSLRSAAASIGPALESDRLRVNLYDDQEYMNQAVGYEGDGGY